MALRGLLRHGGVDRSVAFLAGVSDRGWEGIRHAVTEAEHGIQSCWCEDVALTEG